MESAICLWLRQTKASFPGECVGLRALLKQQPQIETQSPEYNPKEAWWISPRKDSMVSRQMSMAVWIP